MAHINNIGSSMFTDMAVAMPATDPNFDTLATQVAFDGLFASEINSVGGTKGANTYVRVKNVRDFPAMGVPPSVTNVPVYGQKTSQQIQGQADAPSIEITLNYVASDWAKGTLLGDAVGNSKQYVFRFALLNAKPDGYDSDATGLGTVANSVWYWVGKIESILVTPSLTDSTTATVAITLQSELFGAWTVNV